MIQRQQLLHSFLLLVLLLLGNKLLALMDTTQARIWMFRADTLAYYAQLDSANHYLSLAGDIYESEQLWEEYIFSLTRRGTNYTEAARYDKAQEVLNIAARIREQHLPEYSKSNALIHIHQGFLDASQGKLDEALLAYQSCLDLRTQLYGPEHPQLASVYLNIGVVVASLGKDREGIEWQEKAIHIMENNPDYPGMDLSSSYNNLAVSMGTLGDWDQALSYLLKAYELDLKQLGAEHPYVAIACNNIGFIYAKKGDHQRATSFYQQALSVNLANYGELHPNVARNHANIAASYMESGDPDAALQEYERALAIRKQVEPDFYERFASIYGNTGMIKLRQGKLEEAKADIREEIHLLTQAHPGPHPSKGKSLTHLGLCYINGKQYSKGLEYLQKGLTVLQEFYSAPHDQLVLTYRYIADTYVQMKAYDQAGIYYQKAVQAAMKVDDTFESLPSFSSLQPSPELLIVISNWSQSLQWQSADESDPYPLLELALHTSQLGNQIADSLRSTYRYRDSQAQLTASIKELFETGIQSCVRLFEVSQDSAYLETAFQISEKGKFLILLNARNASQAKKFAGIPDSLIEKEKDLELSITYYEKKLYAGKEEETHQQTVNEMNQTLFFLKEERNALLARLEQEFPMYYQLKYPSVNLPIQRIQTDILAPDQSLLEYFIGRDSLYLFCVNASSISVQVVPIAEQDLAQMIDSLRNSIFGYHIFPYPDENIYKKASKEFARFSSQLYQILIEPVESHLADRVILVPDGIMGYIPFAALLTEQTSIPTNFRKHAYLIEDHSLSYAFSANILYAYKQQNTSRASKQKGILALAPDFSYKEYETTSIDAYRNDFLGPLHYNKTEIRSITHIIPGRRLFNQEASLDNFLTLAPDYSILHIATHGKANEREADYSFIAFAPEGESQEPGLLYIRDLYNLKLNADLVVLSACETGIGELQDGEGIVSLAQGFAYAGVPSMLTTLWSINDQQTALWMQGFYQNLLLRIPKDKAVQQANLEYLATQDDFHSHPFFWAPYIAVGDMEALTISGGYPWRNIGIGILIIFLLAIGGMFIWQKKGSKQKF